MGLLVTDPRRSGVSLAPLDISTNGGARYMDEVCGKDAALILVFPQKATKQTKGE